MSDEADRLLEQLERNAARDLHGPSRAPGRDVHLRRTPAADPAPAAPVPARGDGPALPLGTVLEHPCPDCGAEMVLRHSDRYGLFYGCRGWPDCKATHGAHADGHPLGVPADPVTKLFRRAAHGTFDLLWKGTTGRMSRTKAYRWLRKAMDLDADAAHIGRFDRAQCRELIRLVLGKLETDALEAGLREDDRPLAPEEIQPEVERQIREMVECLDGEYDPDDPGDPTPPPDMGGTGGDGEPRWISADTD